MPHKSFHVFKIILVFTREVHYIIVEIFDGTTDKVKKQPTWLFALIRMCPVTWPSGPEPKGFSMLKLARASSPNILFA